MLTPEGVMRNRPSSRRRGEVSVVAGHIAPLVEEVAGLTQLGLAKARALGAPWPGM